MMKSSVILFLLIIPLFVGGQVELDVDILPRVNDVYNSFIDDLPEINAGRQGRDEYWDFSSLSSGLIYSSQKFPPDPVLIFNKIDYDFFTKEGQSIYKMYRREGESLYEIAIQRPHIFNSDFIVFAKYEEPKLVGYAPLEYRSEKTNRSLIHYDMPREKIPDLIMRKLPVTPDSLRLVVNEVKDFRVDASGTMSLSYGRYEVLRQEITTRTTTDVEIFSAGKWSQINNNILDPTGEVLGVASEKKYVFYTDEVRLPLVTITLDENDDIKFVEVKAPEQTEDYVRADTDKAMLILSPNPTYGEVKLEMMNLDPGLYNFEVSNIIGKKLWSEELEISRKLNTLRYNFGFLGKGTYLWSITDAKGVRMTTKRLVIVTP